MRRKISTVEGTKYSKSKKEINILHCPSKKIEQICLSKDGNSKQNEEFEEVSAEVDGHSLMEQTAGMTQMLQEEIRYHL